jgi:antibiotic biosynthesis monooxygenase (ABM) superfamily enzyme
MDLKGVWLGLKAAILSSCCCSLPLAMVLAFWALGAGSVEAALKVPRYKIYFMGVGTVFLLASVYFSIKGAGTTCRFSDVKRQWQFVAVSMISYVTFTLMIIYVVLPAVSELVFSWAF